MLEIPREIGVPILILVGSLVGLLLSIVPMAVNRLWPSMQTRFRRGVHSGYSVVYAGIGVWVHHALGVAYSQALAEIDPEGGCSWGEDTSACPPWDGRHGWILVWIVAGLVAYALARRSATRSRPCSTGWGKQLVRERNG